MLHTDTRLTGVLNCYDLMQQPGIMGDDVQGVARWFAEDAATADMIEKRPFLAQPREETARKTTSCRFSQPNAQDQNNKTGGNICI